MVRDRLVVGNIYKIVTNDYTKAIGYLCSNGGVGKEEEFYFSACSPEGSSLVSVYETKSYKNITKQINNE